MNVSGKLIVVLIFSSALLVGCDNNKEVAIATVNGKPIAQEQFDAYLELKRLNTNDEKRSDALLEQYLEREALSSAIEQRGVLNQKLTQAEVNEFRKEMLISRYFETFLKQQVSDQAVQNYYAKHPELYQEQKAHVAHILHRTNRNMGETERKAKLTSSQAAYAQLKSGKAFADIAKEYSEDAISAKKGGDLDWLKKGAIDERFSDVVFNMQPGEVSEPFETAFGFHIVKLIEGPSVVKKPFDAVKGDIRYQLRNQAKDAELKRLLAEVNVKRHD